MSKSLLLTYEDQSIQFRDDGWFNATNAGERFGKRPNDWLSLPSTAEYISALERRYGKIRYVRTSRARADRGGGTWLHPKLGVPFARWLDVDFAVWCDEQIARIIHGDPGTIDWRRLRHEAAASYKVMSAILQETRRDAGKKTASHHFINEAKLVNWALSGEFKGLDRDGLTGAELDVLARLEERNAVLIARGADREQRKADLLALAGDRWLPNENAPVGMIHQGVDLVRQDRVISKPSREGRQPQPA